MSEGKQGNIFYNTATLLQEPKRETADRADVSTVTARKKVAITVFNDTTGDIQKKIPMTSFLYTYGQDGINDYGSGDDVNNWDQAQSWKPEYTQ